MTMRKEADLKRELAELEDHIDNYALPKLEIKYLKKQARRKRWLIVHRWLEGDPPGYTDSMLNRGKPGKPDTVTKSYRKGISRKKYREWLEQK